MLEIKIMRVCLQALLILYLNDLLAEISQNSQHPDKQKQENVSNCVKNYFLK